MYTCTDDTFLTLFLFIIKSYEMPVALLHKIYLFTNNLKLGIKPASVTVGVAVFFLLFCRYLNFSLSLFIQFYEINITKNGVSSFTKFLIHTHIYSCFWFMHTYITYCCVYFSFRAFLYLCAFVFFSLSCLGFFFLFLLFTIFFLFSMRRDCLFQYFVSSSQACVFYFPTHTGCSSFSENNRYGR